MARPLWIRAVVGTRVDTKEEANGLQIRKWIPKEYIPKTNPMVSRENAVVWYQN